MGSHSELPSYHFEQTTPIDSELRPSIESQIASILQAEASGQLIPTPDSLIQLGASLRLATELFIVTTFQSYVVQHLGQEFNRYPRIPETTFPTTLDSYDQNGLDQFYHQSIGRKHVDSDLWRARLLVFMSSRISDMFSRGYGEFRDKQGSVHFDDSLHFVINHNFVIVDLGVPIIDSKQVSLSPGSKQTDQLHRTTLLTPEDFSGQLLTHALSADALNSVINDSMISFGGQIGRVCTSRHLISIDPDHSCGEHVIIIDPQVLSKAGIPIMTVDEGGQYGLINDGQIIQEVRFGLPIPLFLAAGIFSNLFFRNPNENIRVRRFENPSTGDMLPTPGTCAYGQETLTLLATQLYPQRVIS